MDDVKPTTNKVCRGGGGEGYKKVAGKLSPISVMIRCKVPQCLKQEMIQFIMAKQCVKKPNQVDITAKNCDTKITKISNKTQLKI